ncbi:MAG: 4Fe-4S cluster-binding domain-containing protein [Tissierellia bacterium]|nr:4Fe-4S cluster-binding domain-containing protein [Tissierellia bacterium]
MVSIRLKNIIDEVFQDYKKPSMMLATCKCDWKCCIEENLDISICQNSDLSKQKSINIPADIIIGRYINNPLTNAIIIGGLEPFLQFKEILEFVKVFREFSKDDLVIYTGYYPYEIKNYIQELKKYPNIIVKFGRYKENHNKVFDMILGIWLPSDNQYAVKIS